MNKLSSLVLMLSVLTIVCCGKKENASGTVPSTNPPTTSPVTTVVDNPSIQQTVLGSIDTNFNRGSVFQVGSVQYAIIDSGNPSIMYNAYAQATEKGVIQSNITRYNVQITGTFVNNGAGGRVTVSQAVFSR